MACAENRGGHCRSAYANPPRVPASWEWPAQVRWWSQTQTANFGSINRGWAHNLFSADQAEESGNRMREQHSRGVILHLNGGTDINASDYSQETRGFRRGLTPSNFPARPRGKVYLSMGPSLTISDANLDNYVIPNWERGGGAYQGGDTGGWDGIVINAEAQFEELGRTNPEQARARIRNCADRLRPLLDGGLLLYSNRPVHAPPYQGRTWQQEFDGWLAQIYFSIKSNADNLWHYDAVYAYNWVRDRYQNEAYKQNFDLPLKPLIPVGSCFGGGCKDGDHPMLQIADKCLDLGIKRYDTATWWTYPGTSRMHPIFKKYPSYISSEGTDPCAPTAEDPDPCPPQPCDPMPCPDPPDPCLEPNPPAYCDECVGEECLDPCEDNPCDPECTEPIPPCPPGQHRDANCVCVPDADPPPPSSTQGCY